MNLVERTVTVRRRGSDNRSLPGQFEQKTVLLIDQDYGQARKKRQQLERESRFKKWQSLTPSQQLADLDRRLGKGVGAGKQRARIAEAIKKQPEAAKRGNKKK